MIYSWEKPEFILEIHNLGKNILINTHRVLIVGDLKNRVISIPTDMESRFKIFKQSRNNLPKKGWTSSS